MTQIEAKSIENWLRYKANPEIAFVGALAHGHFPGSVKAAFVALWRGDNGCTFMEGV